MLQLALTDAFSYNQATAAGGIDGSILLELDRESSAGLKPAAALVTRLAKELKRVTEVSYADLIAFAGAEALECTGGPRSLLQIGRQSSASPSRARAGFSWEAPTLDGVRAVGKASGLSAREMRRARRRGRGAQDRVACAAAGGGRGGRRPARRGHDARGDGPRRLVVRAEQERRQGDRPELLREEQARRRRPRAEARRDALRQLVLPAGRRQEARAHALRGARSSPTRSGSRSSRSTPSRSRPSARTCAARTPR